MINAILLQNNLLFVCIAWTFEFERDEICIVETRTFYKEGK